MEWRDQDDIEEDFEGDLEEANQDQHELSNSMTEAKLKQYKDFSRSSFDLAKYKEAQQGVQVMSIDVTYGNKPTQDSQGRRVMRPVIKIYAVNKEGNSFLIHVKNFIPYFYVPYPRGLVNTPENLQLFRQALNKLFRDIEQSRHKKEYFQKNYATEEAVLSLQAVKKVNIRGYVPIQNQQNYLYLKINTCSPNVVAPLRNIFERQNRIRGILLPNQTFQSNIPYALRFMVDKGLTGMGWFRIKGTQYKLRENLKESNCQIELECNQTAIQQLKCQGDWAMIAPLRVLSFDIECAAQHGFPSAQKDPIIQIACVCKTLAGPDPDQYRVVLVLNGCSSISGAEIKQTNDEGQLLIYFQQLMLSYDPDFIIGYNIINFDLTYILDRAAKLRVPNFGYFGRSHTISRIKKGRLQSKIMGNRQIKDINIEGRIQLDLLIHMHREHKLSSYSLNNVSYHFLRDQKQDVHHTEVYKLFMKDRDARKRLAIYCLKDAQLPLKLMEKLCCLYNYAEMARVTGVTVNFLLNRGQQIKVVSQLLRKARQKNFILPTNKSSKGSDQKGFEGAYVLDPMVGFYKQPIATLDFASLYPSIMMAHNLCYTTLVNANQLEQLGLINQDVTKTPEGYYFVTNRQKRQGLLPQILQELISARKKAKQELAKAEDQMMKNVLEGRQLALKISANSVYGFTGATVGQLPCLEISSSVTAFGREMINITRNKVKQLFPGSEVIYGDTDSVMVRFKLEKSQDKERKYQIEESMEFGRKAAKLISGQFISPIKLEFQKVYCPFLLMAKKRYVGVYYSSSCEKPDKIDKKGFESVRRDNCYLIREMLQNILDLLLCKNDIKGIEHYVKKMVSDLVQNKIDISKLVITKAISKNTTEDDEEDQKGKASGKSGKNTYKVKQAHVQLAHKMQKRDANITLGIGDRISYVMITGQKGSKNYDNAEDPIKVLNEDIAIDYDYYIQKQLRPPLERLLNKTNIFHNLDAFFIGDHTKNRYMPKVNKNNFLGKFVTVFSTCINCPAKSNDPLCERCKNKSLQILVAKQIQMEIMKAEYQELWGECQECQGSVTMQILCENNDCPIYYRRIKIKNDLEGRKKQVTKLNALCLEF